MRLSGLGRAGEYACLYCLRVKIPAPLPDPGRPGVLCRWFPGEATTRCWDLGGERRCFNGDEPTANATCFCLGDLRTGLGCSG